MTKKIIGLKSKKGLAIMEVMWFSIVLFVFIFISMIVFQSYQEISPSLKESLIEDGGNESVKVITDLDTRYPATFDALGVLLFFLMWMVVIVATFVRSNHPLFFVVSIVIFVFILISISLLNNFYDELSEDDSLDGMTTSFPMSSWLLSNLFFVVLITGFTVFLTMYLTRNQI